MKNTDQRRKQMEQVKSWMRYKQFENVTFINGWQVLRVK